jgi:hypothetical protein
MMLVVLLALGLTVACGSAATLSPVEAAFQRSMQAMNNVDTFGMEGTFKAF